MIFTDQEIVNDTPVTSTELLARGGNWLGLIREYIKCKARNGEYVTWGSQEHLEGFNPTVFDMEHLAASIAAEAANEARRTIKSFMRRFRPSGLGVKDIAGPTTIVTPIVLKDNGKLNHIYCCAAYSWIDGSMAYGQGTFSAHGTWSNPCEQCTHAAKVLGEHDEIPEDEDDAS